MNQTTSLRNKHEIEHFTHLEHIWWGAKTVAGQRRYDNKLKILKKMCDMNPRLKVLEIGAGDGEFTKRLSKLKCQVIATDITPAVVKKGRKLIKSKNIKFMVADAHKLTFKNNCFDLVCGVSILHHIETKKALKEAFRVLKPGGKIFFTEPNLLNPHNFLGLHISWMRTRMEFSQDETALIKGQVNELLKSIGFKNIKVKNYDFLHPMTPPTLISTVEKLGLVLEKLPFIREISGSLIVYGEK